MYHMFPTECQTQFRRRQDSRKTRPSRRAARASTCPAPTRPRPGAGPRASSLASQSFTFSNPATASPGLAGQRHDGRRPAATSRPRPRPTRPSGTVTGFRAARANRRFCTAVSSASRSAATQMPRPGSLPRTSGTTSPSGPDDEADQAPLSGCTSPVDDAAPLRARPGVLSRPPRVIAQLPGLRSGLGLLFRVALLGGLVVRGSRSAGSTQPSWTRAVMTRSCASSRLTCRTSRARRRPSTRSPSTVVQPPASSQSAQVAKSSSVFTPSLASASTIWGVSPSKSMRLSSAPSARAAFQRLAVLLLDVVAGAGLKLVAPCPRRRRRSPAARRCRRRRPPRGW